MIALWTCLGFGLGALSGWAREFRVSQLPNGNVISCAACHISPAGGGPRNPFGRAVEAITGTSPRPFWSATLAAADADGDGFTNGVELGDPDGDGAVIPGWKPTNPGLASSRPANAAPTVTVTAPADGATLTAPAVAAATANATDTDGTVARVEFFDAGVSLGADTTSPFSIVVDWGVGAHVLTAKATDNQGASTTSAPVSFTVAPASAVTLAVPVAEGANLRLTWTGGGGPFAVETKADLGSPWTPAEVVVTTREATLAAGGTAGFVRVGDTAVIGPLPLTASLSGASERPTPVNSAGTGSGTFTLSNNTLTFQITYSGLTSVATAAHLHGPASVEEAAPPMIDLVPFHSGPLSTTGVFTGSVILTADQKAAILAGKAYVNIHTVNFGAGEIRGQIRR
jgi:hypothetical protein